MTTQNNDFLLVGEGEEAKSMIDCLERRIKSIKETLMPMWEKNGVKDQIAYLEKSEKAHQDLIEKIKRGEMTSGECQKLKDAFTREMMNSQ